MGFGFSLALTAAGAILAWAVNASSSAVNVNTIGYILFVVGLVGLALSIVFWSSWADRERSTAAGGLRSTRRAERA